MGRGAHSTLASPLHRLTHQAPSKSRPFTLLHSLLTKRHDQNQGPPFRDDPKPDEINLGTPTWTESAQTPSSRCPTAPSCVNTQNPISLC
ncbi:hypothetical protein B0H19DRAFT_1134185 [Mycena capillaripes]|nr:hypothetical protein B0H19DRAFT_1134185 [Mycena capillaripes]